MSVIDNALQALFINGVKLIKLWENSSPTSNFAAQKLQLSLAEYDEVEIRALMSTTSENAIIIRIPVGENGTLFKPLIQSLRYREITSVDASGVTFSTGQNATWNGNSVTNNNQLIPVAIYGIKLLGGVIHKLKILAASLLHEGRCWHERIG